VRCGEGDAADRDRSQRVDHRSVLRPVLRTCHTPTLFVGYASAPPTTRFVALRQSRANGAGRRTHSSSGSSASSFGYGSREMRAQMRALCHRQGSADQRPRAAARRRRPRHSRCTHQHTGARAGNEPPLAYPPFPAACPACHSARRKRSSSVQNFNALTFAPQLGSRVAQILPRD
jgi:hypothetical protein